MKFCPECGMPLEGKDKCSCGFIVSENRVEKPVKDNKIYFTEPPYQNGNDFEQAIMEIPLEELKRRKLDRGELLSLSFKSYGGMEGMSYSKCVDFENNQIIIENRPHHNSNQTKTVYSASKEELDKIKNIIIENNMGAWQEIPANLAFRAYDAPTSYTYIRFSEGSSNISSLANLTEEELKIKGELIELVNSLIKDENKVSEEEVKNENIGAMTGFMGMVDMFNQYTFCPDCGAVMNKDQKECPCGFVKKDTE